MLELPGQTACAGEQFHNQEQRGFTFVLNAAPSDAAEISPRPYGDTTLPLPGTDADLSVQKIPDQIREMLQLYEHGDGSYAKKCKNFYRQARFMEDYEDNMPWSGELTCYFPTYHDLSIRQLRGYFTWRSDVRKGKYNPITASLAYLYLYELLCGIGADCPRESLKKMREFEEGYLDTGIGDPGMRKNLHRWMLEYAVLHDVPAEEARKYADPELLNRDMALAVLKTPCAYTDDEVFSALCVLAGKKLAQSPVSTEEELRKRHLFAEIWRHVSEQRMEKGEDFFAACFRGQETFRWYPLSNAVWWEDGRHADADYILNESRSYHCRNGIWQERCYENLYFNKTRFQALIHEADRAIRIYLKVGHHLRERPGDRWAKPFVNAVIEADKKAREDAARPRITINLSKLEQIRANASITRDSLLTEEETMELLPQKPAAAEESRMENKAHFSKGTVFGNQSAPDEKRMTSEAELKGIDSLHAEILSALIRGEFAEERIRYHHLMPAIVTDTINEAFFDEIGDNILECDGDTITVVEDYKEDVEALLGGTGR